QEGVARGHVAAGQVGPTHGTEAGISPDGGIETLLNLRRRNCPCRGRNMATAASAAIRSQALEERVGDVDSTSSVKRAQHAGGIRRIQWVGQLTAPECAERQR